MKPLLRTLAVTGLLLITPLALRAQNAITTTITHEVHDHSFSLGRDFWFAFPMNYQDQSGKYLRIYVTSQSNTNAYVQVGPNGSTIVVPVQAGKVGTANIPLGWEMKSSGIVEDKAVHVWSNDADISVYFMSHNPYTSDGSYAIPTAGWGTDYVVAAFAALFEGFGSYVFDFPSEMTIVAQQDNTVVEVVPSANIRQAAGYPQNATDTAYPKGQKFIVTLNRGQSVQFQTVKATDIVGYDLTGTIVHSNKPIGVLGASQCPNIPPDFPYCDFVCEMNLPTRSWGKTYYTNNFIQPAGMPGHDFALYLLVSSQPGQKIYRHYGSKDTLECTISDQYGTFWAEEEQANKWYSDAPFLLMQYMNSSTYPDNNNGNGDPSEMMVNPRENFTNQVSFQTPISVGSQTPYDCYADLIIDHRDVNFVTVDNQSILNYDHQSIDDTFDVYVVPHIRPGAHTVKGATNGMGVSIYGYGYDESFAWGSPGFLGTFASPDTVPPKVTTTTTCFNGRVHITDSGSVAGIAQSHLDEIRIDTSSNMAYQPNYYPNWLDGAGIDTSGYSFFVANRAKPGLLVVSAFDLAGNRTTIQSTYNPTDSLAFSPTDLDFGASSIGGPTIYLYDTITNPGAFIVDIESLSLQDTTLGFAIDSAAVPISLAAGKSFIARLRFHSRYMGPVFDTLLADLGCDTASLIPITGNGGLPAFTVSDVNWTDIPMGLGILYPKNAVVRNNTQQLTLSIPVPVWSDTKHFMLTSALQFPLTIAPQSTALAQFYFEPTDHNPDTTLVSWVSPQVVNKDGSYKIVTSMLTGLAAASGVESDRTANLQLRTAGEHRIEIIGTVNNAASLELFNILGERVFIAKPAGDGVLDVGALAAGVYLYRLTSGAATMTGKVVLGE